MWILIQKINTKNFFREIDYQLRGNSILSFTWSIIDESRYLLVNNFVKNVNLPVKFCRLFDFDRNTSRMS